MPPSISLVLGPFLPTHYSRHQWKNRREKFHAVLKNDFAGTSHHQPSFQGSGTNVNSVFPSSLSLWWCCRDCDLLWLFEGCSFTFRTGLMSPVGDATLPASLLTHPVFLLPSLDSAVTRGRRALLPHILALFNCPVPLAFARHLQHFLLCSLDTVCRHPPSLSSSNST